MLLETLQILVTGYVAFGVMMNEFAWVSASLAYVCVLLCFMGSVTCILIVR